MNKGDDLAGRLLAFTVQIIKLVGELPNTIVGRHIGGQLLRSGTSPGSNYEESRGAESRADFVHKLGIVLKEMNYPAVPKAFGTRYLISPLPRGEGMKGRVLKIIITKHPHPNPPPSMGRELFGNPDAKHRGIL